MKNILHIISSPNGDYSNSIKLGNAIVNKLQEANPGATVRENNLTTKVFPHLRGEQIASFFTPAEFRTPENIAAAKFSDETIQELLDADILVIGAPFYNFSIPSSLKAWIDHIVRAGITFNMNEKGYQGLISGKKAYIAISSGGIYSEGAMKSYDFSAPYLKAILGFIGITDITVIRVEGTAIPGVQDTALENAINSIAL